jgi:hypothetical protein
MLVISCNTADGCDSCKQFGGFLRIGGPSRHFRPTLGFIALALHGEAFSLRVMQDINECDEINSISSVSEADDKQCCTGAGTLVVISASSHPAATGRPTLGCVPAHKSNGGPSNEALSCW